MSDRAAEATRFDEQPDHGLRAPKARATWRKLLSSALLAEQRYEVTGVDLSPATVALAKAKAAGAAEDREGDAAHPTLAPSTFDAGFARHVLWTLPAPEAVVGRWIELLRPGGRLVLVEGPGRPITDERYVLVSSRKLI
ncbi:class I SAM-dependent methyltransferase [Actinophytocola sp. KF-1]